MNTTETDEMTFFEKNGIRYEQRGDFYILFLEHVTMQQLQVLASMEHCG